MVNKHAAALGSITSERKKKSSKENGKKGGRPRTKHAKQRRKEHPLKATGAPLQTSIRKEL